MGAGTEQFNLIIASGDLPDMMESNWSTYSSGPERAMNDGVILKLNDIFIEHAPNPVLRKGDKPILNMLQWEYPGMYSAALTKNCRDIERSSQFLDFLFTEAGAFFSNYGVEGKSYTMVNGKLKYTDFVLNNPDKWTVADAVSTWTNNSFNGTGLWIADGLMQQFVYPGQLAAWDAWQPTPEVLKYRLPPIISTTEESAEFSGIMNEINTYYRETMTKYILGFEDLATFNTYVNTIKRMGIDRAIEIQNAAYCSLGFITANTMGRKSGL
jgi:putative aldouronate transport system substrate-binding protein